VSLKILLADDSMTAQNMGKKILSEAGYDVLAVSNGAAAMKKLTAAQFDLLLLDVFMPGYSGPEICEKVRALKNYAKVPILLTIGKMEMGEFKVDDAPKFKADGVIIKPFEATDLVTAVQKMAAGIAPPKPATPPEAEKTVKLKPIAEEGDASYKQWSDSAPEHAGEAHEAPPAAAAPVAAAEMSAEAAGSPAFDVTSAAPAFDFGSSAYESGPSGHGSDVAAELGLGGAAAAAAPSAEIPLEAAPAPVSTTAPELELPPSDAQVGPITPAPGIEFTSAAPVDVQVEALPDFEPESRDDSTPVVADPNFLSDRSQMVTDFATKFSDTASDDITVGVVGAEAAAPAPEATAEIHAVEPPSPTVAHPPQIGEETAKMSPWVSEAAKEPEPPAAHEEPAAVVAAPEPPAPEPPAPVVEAAPEPPPAPPVEVAAEPAPAAPEPMPEPPPAKPAGDLEFAQALQAAIANAPVADAEPEPPAPDAPAPAPQQAQVAAAAAAAAAAVPELAGVDPSVVQRAVERVLSNAKQDIIAEILKELKK